MRGATTLLAGLLTVIAVLVSGGSLQAASGATPVAWRGDFETGDLSQWLTFQARESNRVTVQSNIVRQGNYAAKFEVHPGDNNVAGSGTGERAEVWIRTPDTDGYEGREAYWAWSTYFPSDFTAPRGIWNIFTQFHHTGLTGQANVHFAVRQDSRIELRVLGGDLNRPTQRSFVLTRLKKGRWFDFVFHVKWSSSARSGFVEVWVDGSRVVRRTPTPTLYAGHAVYLKQGYYRAAHTGTSVVYIDGTRRASTFAGVGGRGRKPSIPE